MRPAKITQVHIAASSHAPDDISEKSDASRMPLKLGLTESLEFPVSEESFLLVNAVSLISN